MINLRFNVHGVIYIPDDGQTAPIEKEIRALADSLQDVKDEQEYIVVRERVHRNSQCLLICIVSSDAFVR